MVFVLGYAWLLGTSHPWQRTPVERPGPFPERSAPVLGITVADTTREPVRDRAGASGHPSGGFDAAKKARSARHARLQAEHERLLRQIEVEDARLETSERDLAQGQQQISAEAAALALRRHVRRAEKADLDQEHQRLEAQGKRIDTHRQWLVTARTRLRADALSLDETEPDAVAAYNVGIARYRAAKATFNEEIARFNRATDAYTQAEERYFRAKEAFNAGAERYNQRLHALRRVARAHNRRLLHCRGSIERARQIEQALAR